MKMAALITLFALFSSFAWAEKILIDPESVAKESVYPNFKAVEAVKNKRYPLMGRVQADLMLGITRNDAFFDSKNASLFLGYNFSEEQAIQLFASFFFSTTPTPESEALDAQTDVKNLDLAPQPGYLLSLGYKIVPYYGKISVSKKQAYNFNVYGSVGPAFVNFEGKFFPGGVLGVGQSLYFANGWGLTVDFRGLFYNGPDPLSVDLTGLTSTPDIDQFSEVFSFNLLINVGLAKLF